MFVINNTGGRELETGQHALVVTHAPREHLLCVRKDERLVARARREVLELTAIGFEVEK